MITAGIDVGSSAVKVALMQSEPGDHPGPSKGAVEELLGSRVERLRRRDPAEVAQRIYADMLEEAGVSAAEVVYVATTGEGDRVEFRTGHFYGMTAHARGALYLMPEARAVLDVGGLHARAMITDPRSKVLGYRMTSQCASGSGQFLENIGRYLGVTLEEIGEMSVQSKDPEKSSSICAVLAETDVINMVSRGIEVADILKGIHLSMAGRYVRLLLASGADGTVLLTGGLAADRGLAAALSEESERQRGNLSIHTHEQSVLAGAIGAALWGGFRFRTLEKRGIGLRA